MKIRNILPYVALIGAGIALLMSDPHSWVLIPLGLVLAATVATDIYRATHQ